MNAVVDLLDRLSQATLPASRRRVVQEALTWLHTPYHHHARIKGVGVDCAQILAAVYSAAGVTGAVELGDYAPQWHLHRDEERYLQALKAQGARRVDQPQPGDVGVWRFGRTFSHGGIVIEGGADPLVLHAYVDRGVILSRTREAPLCGRLHTFWAVIP